MVDEMAWCIRQYFLWHLCSTKHRHRVKIETRRLLVSEIGLFFWKCPPFCLNGLQMADTMAWCIRQYHFGNQRPRKPTYIHIFIHFKPRGFYGTIVVTLARHIARFAAIATSCGSGTPWQSLKRLLVGYITESDTSAMSAHRTILSAGMRSTCPR